MSSQRYYWIKLKEDFWDLPEIDWLQDQEKGCEYIVLYQKLCTLTANNNGELSRKVGEMVIAYDVKKIAALTRFDFDTVAVALELYKKIGLIYQKENGLLAISNIGEMVGSETKWAARKRKQRLDNVQKMSLKCLTQKSGQNAKKCPGDIRDKRLDIDTDKNIKKDIYSPAKPDITPSKQKKDTNFSSQAKDIIDYLNAKLDTKYKTDNKKTLELIKARLKEGFTVEDFKTVIDKKSFEWGNDSNMCQYLRPVTLFSTKFESYLNQPFTKQMSETDKSIMKMLNRDGDWEWG